MPVRIPISKPFFGPEEREALLKPLETGWVVQGPFVAEFEAKFNAYTGSRHSAAASSCTTAMHLAVAALGLGPGDEVIVPSFTWVATANVVEYMGATPVFCDIDLATFNLDVAQLPSLVTPRTVGIIPVHLFGLCADMDAVSAVAARHGLWVLEDAACGFGARIRGQHAGTFGTFGCFSFHPRKAITTGEGGMVTTADDRLDAMVRSLRDHGATRSDFARHHAAASYLLPEYNVVGYNFRMTDIQGALGSVQMDRAAMLLAERQRQARFYDERLRAVSSLRTPVTPEGYEHGYQSYVCLFAPEEPTLDNVDALHAQRNALMTSLEEQGIATRQGTHAPVLTGYYSKKYNLTREDFPRACIAERLSLSLPIYAQLTDEELELVCGALQQVAHA